MKLAEGILITLLIITIILSFGHVTGGRILFTLMCLIVSVYYLLGSLFVFNAIAIGRGFKKSTYSGISKSEIVMSVVSGIALFQFLGALLFLVNDWIAQGVLSFIAYLLLIPCITLVALMLPKNSTRIRILSRLIPAIILLTLIVFYCYTNPRL